MEVSVKREITEMSEVVDSEVLPNGDDSAFSAAENDGDHADTASQHSVSISEIEQESNTECLAVVPSEDGEVLPDQVFVATSQGLLTAAQLQEAGIKTTHIVIHDQSALTVAAAAAAAASGDPNAGVPLKTPTTPLPPPTPATPLSRERGFRYQWDESAYNDVLPVRCKSSNGELFKSKFGSGEFNLIYTVDIIYPTMVQWCTAKIYVPLK